jgi:hypothetical protein
MSTVVVSFRPPRGYSGSPLRAPQDRLHSEPSRRGLGGEAFEGEVLRLFDRDGDELIRASGELEGD